MTKSNQHRSAVAKATAASLLVHVSVALALVILPEPAPSEAPPPADAIQLTWLDAPPVPEPAPNPTPTPAPSQDARAPAPGSGVPEPAPGPEREPEPEEAGPQDAGAGTRDGPGPPEPASAPSADGSSPLSLRGLRGGDSARASSGPGVVPAPSEAIAHLTPRPMPRPAAPQGPVLPPEDREVRSLEEAGFRKGKNGTYKLGKLSSSFSATVHPDGRVSFRDKSFNVNPARLGTGLLAPQRLAGEEQFRTLKTRLLRQTFELRMQMARSWSTKHMRTQLAALGRQLEQTWSRADWSTQRRRKMLFTLWDDCVEPPAEAGRRDADSVDDSLDQARVEAGVKARKTVIAFIKAELPQGSADAYPPAELEALNRSRESRSRFDPYGSG